MTGFLKCKNCLPSSVEKAIVGPIRPIVSLILIRFSLNRTVSRTAFNFQMSLNFVHIELFTSEFRALDLKA